MMAGKVAVVAGYGGVGAVRTIDWQTAGSDGWQVTLSPYDTGKPPKGASSIAPFDVNLLAKQGKDKQDAEFDSMGRELLGKD